MIPQSTITFENTLAYKSLVDDPKSFSHMQSIDEDKCTASRADHDTVTMPRSIHDTPLEHVPQSNKAATLSKLLKMSKDSEPSTSSSSPLKILREKSLAIGKPRLKILPSVGSESINSTTFLLDHDGENPCETPSYLASAGGNFNLEPKELQHQRCSLELPPTLSSKHIDDDANILPLPPKPKAASLSFPQKRHIRKHPLIIPVNGIQRTLDKINQTTPVEEKQYDFQVPSDDAPHPHKEPTTVPHAIDDDDDDDDVFEDLKKDTKILQEIEENVNSHYGKIKSTEKVFTRDFIENNFPDTPTAASCSDAFKRSSFVDVNGQRTYENIEAFQRRFSLDEQDTASLDFESILEHDEHVTKVTTTSSDDLVDGFCPFESANSANIAAAKDDDAMKPAAAGRPLSIEVKKLEFSQKFPKYKMPRNELASNALFNKIKASVENAAKYGDDEECEVELDVEDVDCDLKRSINHVSCEDLLDFSEMKPKGRERGIESDEVRIMVKMFGTKVSKLKLM